MGSKSPSFASAVWVDGFNPPNRRSAMVIEARWHSSPFRLQRGLPYLFHRVEKLECRGPIQRAIRRAWLAERHGLHQEKHLHMQSMFHSTLTPTIFRAREHNGNDRALYQAHKMAARRANPDSAS